MKLSKAQKRVLGVMAEEGCRAYLGRWGLEFHAYFMPDNSQRVRPRTLRKLEGMGLIENVWGLNERWRLDIYYAITDAGRAELQGLS